jgi:hypothetical protein
MARVNALTHLFSAGEISRAALNRVDKEIIRLHAETQENLLPYSIGKAIMRPGLEYLSAAYNGAKPRLIPFVKGIDDVALMELTASALTVRNDGELIEREAVTAEITNGDFSSSAGWTLTTTGAATATISSGVLTLAAPSRGGRATCSQEVTANEIGTEHALHIEVTRGPVQFRCGATTGGDEYINETSLDTGTHSLAFNPTGIGGIDSFTVLLLHFEGADASTTFTDSSNFGNDMTAIGAPQIDTAQFKFGTSAGLFTGASGSGRLERFVDPADPDFAFGEDDFTIDFWVRFNSVALQQGLIDFRFTNDASPRPVIYLIGGKISYYVNGAGRITSATSMATATWYHVAVARSGSTTTLYINGVSEGSWVDTTIYTNGAFAPAIGNLADSSDGFDGWMDEFRISKGIARWTSNFAPPTAAYGGAGNTFFVQFSSNLEREIIVDSIEVEDAGTMALSAPWSEGQLREIRHDQSGDVIFLAHSDWQPRKIERRDNRSWSLVKYEAEDGPFTLGRTATTRIKPSATRGNITLTAENAFFRPEHVGALFRLDHERFHATFSLAGEETATNAFRVRGIGTENQWNFAITGTWVGTITQQRSFDGDDVGFGDSGTTHTINASGSVDPPAEYDNQIFWVRYMFKGGAYTSGSATIELTYPGDSAGGVARITGYTSTTVVTAELLDDFNDVVYTASWLEGDWSDRRGWPEAVGFFDGRLWWARRDKFWGSESDNYYAFNLDTEGDSGSIQRSIAAGGNVNQTQWILGLQRLILGTNAAPMSVRSSSFDEPLTPTNITLKPASPVGAARVSPIAIGARGAFVGIDGKRVFEIAYNIDMQDYVATDLCRINEDLADASNPDLYEDSFVELAYQANPSPYLWALRDDGILTPAIFNPAEEARGWFKVATGRLDALDENRPTDRIVSVAVLPRSIEDEVYLGVERTISDGAGGTERAYYIERFARHKDAVTRVYNSETGEVDVKNGLYLADSYITATGLGGIGQVITGLDHLEGREVIIVGQKVDGGYGPLVNADREIVFHTVNNGQIVTTLPVTGSVCIGLGYEGLYKSAKLAFAGQGGTALLQKKKIDQVGLALVDTHPDAIRVGGSFADDDMDELPRIRGDGARVEDAITTFDRSTEEQPFPFPGSWHTDSRLHIKVRPGYSATLSALLIGVETKERP